MTGTLTKSLCDFTFGMLFAAQVVCTAVMWSRGKTHSLQRVVFWFMLYLLIVSAVEAVFFFTTEDSSSLTSPMTDIMEMTVIPCALLVFLRLVAPERQQVWLIVTNALFYGAALVIYGITDNGWVYHFVMVFSIVYAVFIIVYGIFATHRYNRMLKDNFSDDDLSLYWLKYILIVYAAIMGLWTWASLSGSSYAVVVYNLGTMVFFSLICYFTYRQNDMLEALEKLRANDKPRPSPSLPTSFTERIDRVFREEEIYLNPRLTIGDLATALGTNRTYASNCLNSDMHTSFYEYVNGWRVEKAKQLLLTTDFSLAVIAEKSGFNSLSSFRRYFTASCGTTPTAYRKKDTTGQLHSN